MYTTPYTVPSGQSTLPADSDQRFYSSLLLIFEGVDHGSDLGAMELHGVRSPGARASVAGPPAAGAAVVAAAAAGAGAAGAGRRGRPVPAPPRRRRGRERAAQPGGMVQAAAARLPPHRAPRAALALERRQGPRYRCEVSLSLPLLFLGLRTFNFF